MFVRTPPNRIITRSQGMKIDEINVVPDPNKIITLDVSKDSLFDELLLIPNIDENAKTKNSFPEIPVSMKQTIDDELFERLKKYFDDKLIELTKVFVDQITELRTEIATLKNLNSETSLLADKLIESENNKDDGITDVSMKSKAESSKLDIEGKCNYLELENNLSIAVVENICYQGYLSPFNLAATVFRSINFNFDDTTLVNAYINTMKNGRKKLTLKFNSKLVRNDFLELFGSFGYVTNFNLGFNDHSRIFAKEKLTRDNKNIYFHARRLLRDGGIKDFSTNSGFIYVLPTNMCSFDHENYIQINNLDDLEKLNLFNNSS